MDIPKNVLLVEDDESVRTVIGTILKSHGYQVTPAEDGQDALGKLQGVDVVLLDLLLPKMSGEEFLTDVRSKGNYVPVVLMSASIPSDEAQCRFKDLQIVDFVPKPFKIKDLLEKLEKATSVSDDLNFVKVATNRVKGFINRQLGF